MPHQTDNAIAFNMVRAQSERTGVPWITDYRTKKSDPERRPTVIPGYRPYLPIVRSHEFRAILGGIAFQAGGSFCDAAGQTT